MSFAICAAVAMFSAAPPGRSPFPTTRLEQPVPGPARGLSPDAWREGKLCNVTQPPFNAVGGVCVVVYMCVLQGVDLCVLASCADTLPVDGKTNNTAALQRAIDACGNLAEGGTVLLPAGGGSFVSGSLWLKSNLTFRIEKGSTLLGGTAMQDAPVVYSRRECVMMDAHAGLLNGALCHGMVASPTGGDDCKEWGKLENVVIEGEGTIDGDGEHWFKSKAGRARPMMVDLLWINGLTIRDLHIRRPG